MTQRLLQQDAVLAVLAKGATVVTAGERLARAVQWAHAEAQQAAGRKAWERARVFSWRALLAQLWSEGVSAAPAASAAPQLLSGVQADVLWETVVRGSSAGSGLLQPRAAARAAQESWALCRSYRLDPAQFAASGNADAEQFAAWAAAFGAQCARAHWLDPARLPDALAARIRTGDIVLPKAMRFAGFHEWTPLQQQFLQALNAAGCMAESGEPGCLPPANTHRVTCEDGNEELRRAALWAAALLEQAPATRIGIVVHDLATVGPAMMRALDDALCPSARVGLESDRPYNLSLGRPLADAPVIHDALLLLELFVHTPAGFPAVSQWLRSPFVRAAESERAPRLRLEMQLRDIGEQIALPRLLAVAQARDDLPEFAAALAAAMQWQRTQPRRQRYSAWARSFAALLRILGWPGERTHDSAEHQAIESLRSALGDLAGLDLLSEAHSMTEAVAYLTQMVTQQVFQPASEDTPIQVLGLLEATDLHFDHLWIAGWSDEVWPASPRPDPLIPVRVQRAHDMPHASAARELAFAERLTARLLGAAPDVVVSTPQRDADRNLRPSPLIAGLPEIESAQLLQRTVLPYARSLYDARPEFETVNDSRGPALTIYKVHGGTGVLKSQAACPFQAFARYRLAARALRVPEPGLDLLKRGSLLHNILYRLYAELTDQAAILGRDAPTLAEVIRRCVDGALRDARNAQPETFSAHFLMLERERLAALVTGWLAAERARTPFSVAQREFGADVQIGPLQLQTRIDRLDHIAGGGYALIDYKSGDAQSSDWLGERPDEPQLPCYAVTASEEITAVLFGVLRPGETGYRGYAAQAETVVGITAFSELKRPPDDCTSWEALLAHWRAVLMHLADDFAAGVADVAPKNRNQTCRYCDLAPLCRIDEVEAMGDPADD